MYDQSIVRRVMNGDAEAYTKMYEDCAPAVYRRAYDLLQDHSLAREAVRKTFLDIYHSVAQLRQPSDFDEWVYRLVNYHSERLQKSDKLWDEPDLKMVWDELRALVNLDNGIVDNAADAIDSQAGADAEGVWKPILFPPDEAGGEENVGALPWQSDQKKSAAPTSAELLRTTDTSDTPKPAPSDTPPVEQAVREKTAEPPARQTGGDVKPFRAVAEPKEAPPAEKPPVKTQAELVLPPPPPEFKGLARSGKRSRRVRYESASAKSPRYTIERVPYDYLPYDEASQAAYDRIELEESPRAVYEVVPYRFHKNPDGNVVEQVPYQGVQQVAETKERPAPAAPKPKKHAPQSPTAADAAPEKHAPQPPAATSPAPEAPALFVAVEEADLPNVIQPADPADQALQKIETEETTVAIIDESTAQSQSHRRKKRFYADARFFVAVIILIGILVYLGFYFDIL